MLYRRLSARQLGLSLFAALLLGLLAAPRRLVEARPPQAAGPPQLQLSAASYSVNEGAASLNVTVTRTARRLLSTPTEQTPPPPVAATRVGGCKRRLSAAARPGCQVI